MNTGNRFKIRELIYKDLVNVADIHLLAFPDSVLSQLGRKIIIKYYVWQLNPPNECLAVGAYEAEEMAGFCFSGVFSDAEVHFVIRNWYLTVPILLKKPSLFRQIDPIKRLSYIFKALVKNLYSQQQKTHVLETGLKKYGILSIAVAPNYQRSGVGRLLMERVYVDARDKGHNQIRLSVHQDNNQAVQFYEKEGWTKYLDDTNKWSGVMIKKLGIEE